MYEFGLLEPLVGPIVKLDHGAEKGIVLVFLLF
jgi:hypothetical protein